MYGIDVATERFKKARKKHERKESKKHEKKESRIKEAMEHKDVPGAGAKKRKHLKNPKEKIATVMKEFKRGTLHSGKSKASVTNPKQAIAIGLSEARKAGAKIPKKRK